jgi:hypothetical protein
VGATEEIKIFWEATEEIKIFWGATEEIKIFWGAKEEIKIFWGATEEIKIFWGGQQRKLKFSGGQQRKLKRFTSKGWYYFAMELWVGAELFYTDGRIDMKNLMVAFRNLAKAPRNCSSDFSKSVFRLRATR